jgi:hypothetical protein
MELRFPSLPERPARGGSPTPSARAGEGIGRDEATGRIPGSPTSHRTHCPDYTGPRRRSQVDFDA